MRRTKWLQETRKIRFDDSAQTQNIRLTACMERHIFTHDDMEDRMIDPTTLFKALVDETRLRCLMLMVREKELCVCELGYALGVAQPKISRHLAMLRKTEVVQDRRDGQWIYYRLHPNLPAWAQVILHKAAEGSLENDPFQDDLQRLQNMKDRPGRCGNDLSGGKDCC